MMSTPEGMTPERLRAIAARYGEKIEDGAPPAGVLALLVWADELEGSTQPPLPTRDEIEQVIVDVSKRWWPNILFSGTVAEFVVDALLSAGWVRVSGETP